MSRLASLGTDPVITNYAQDATQRAASKIADFIAPTVEVPQLTGYYKKYDAKHRYKVPDTKYAPGEKATRIGFSASDVPYNLQPRALDFPIPKLESLQMAALQNEAMYGIDLLADAAELAREKEVVDMALAAAGAGTNINFNSSSINPIEKIDAEILEVIKSAKNGSEVGVAVGTTAWMHIKNNPLVRGQISEGKSVRRPTIQEFSQMLLSNPEVKISLMVEDTAPENKPESINFILDTGILIFARRERPTTRDASFMKTLRLRNQWMVPGSYETEDGRGDVLKMDWTGMPIETNPAAVKRINSQ